VGVGGGVGAAPRPDLHQPAEPIYLRPPDISQPRPRKP